MKTHYLKKATLHTFPQFKHFHRNLFAVVTFAGIMLLPQTRSISTVVPQGSTSYSFSEVVVATQSLTDVTINCDMVSESAGFIKGIVWSQNSTRVTGPYQGYLFAEDYAGHTFTISLPGNALDPDIAIGCREVSPSQPLLYQMVVAYTDGLTAHVDVYDLNDVGLSTFSIVTPASLSATLSTNCTGMPHIDMWADPSYPFLSNWAAMHEFAVVFSEGPSTCNLKGYINDLASWNGASAPFQINHSSPFGTTPVTNCLRPDVACQSDGEKVMHIVYEEYVPLSPPLNRPFAGTTGMSTLTYNVALGTTILGPLNRRTGWVAFPRIEAINIFDQGILGVNPPYQVAYSYKNDDHVWVFNPLAGNQNASAGDFPSPFQSMSACVAAGLTVNHWFYPNIGNQQYTIGFYPWGDGVSCASSGRVLSNFARDINYNGGNFVSTNTYEVNSNPVDDCWDLNRNMAVSNCSNYGNDILFAWYNGSDIVYKHSTPDVMAFRPSGSGSEHSAGSSDLQVSMSPNPANDAISIQGIAAGANYLITDMAGRTHAHGTIGANHVVSASGLPVGNYILRLIAPGKSLQSFSFSKQ